MSQSMNAQTLKLTEARARVDAAEFQHLRLMNRDLSIEDYGFFITEYFVSKSTIAAKNSKVCAAKGKRAKSILGGIGKTLLAISFAPIAVGASASIFLTMMPFVLMKGCCYFEED